MRWARHLLCLSNLLIESSIQIGYNLENRLSQVDLMARLLLLASQLGVEQRTLALLASDNMRNDINTVMKLLKELSVLFDASFDLSKDQKVSNWISTCR